MICVKRNLLKSEVTIAKKKKKKIQMLYKNEEKKVTQHCSSNKTKIFKKKHNLQLK